MTDYLPPVVAVLGSEISGFTSGIGKAISDMGKAESTMGKLSTLGKAAFLGIGAAAVAVGAASVKFAADFDQQMELIHTQAGASQAEVEQLKNKVLQLAPSVGAGPEKLAEGLYHVESAGFRGAQALDILKAAAQTAAIGQSDLESTSQALIGTMAVQFKDVKDAADAGAYLNTIVGIGDMRMDKLAASIATGVLPSFKSAGLGMRDYGAALATLTDNVTPADEAATRLRMTVSLLAAPSHAADKALGEIGLSGKQLATDMRSPDGLLKAVMDLKEHLEHSGKTAVEQNQIIQHAFGGGRTSGAILTMIEESDRLKSKYEELGTASSRAGKFQDSWASQQQQFSQKVKNLGAELQVIGVKIGNFLIPYLEKAAGWLSKHTEVVKVAAVAIGGVLVAAMMAFTASVIENTIALLADPMTWVFIGVVAAIALVSIGIYELIKHWKTVWGAIKSVAKDVWDWLKGAWDATWHGIMAAVGWIKSKIIDPIVSFFDNYFVKPIKAVISAYVSFWRGVWDVVKTIVQFAWGFISVIFDDVKRVITAVLTPVINGLKETWSTVWGAIKKLFDEWWAGVKIIFGYIDRDGIKPVESGLSWLHKRWDEIWSGIKKLFHEWWDGVKVVFGYVKKDGIDPIHDALTWLGKEWDKIWGGIKSGLDSAWKFMKPIFDKIGGAIHDVKAGFDIISKHPGDAGKTLAHLMGFADGGWVPGSPGEPSLAVVHGGEFVLSRDMLASMRGSGPSVGGTTPLPGLAAGLGAQTIVMHVHTHNYLDGKELHRGLIAPAQQYKARTGTTGLS